MSEDWFDAKNGHPATTCVYSSLRLFKRTLSTLPAKARFMLMSGTMKAAMRSKLLRLLVTVFFPTNISARVAFPR